MKVNMKLWLGSEQSYEEYRQAKISMKSPEHQVLHDRYDDEEDDAPAHYLLEVVDNVGVISIKGSLVSGSVGSWGQYWDMVGYEDIKAAILVALETGVDTLLFDVDSPGGSVSGIAELADFIKDLSVKTVSYTSGVAASGGVWLASASEEFYASRMAEIGSVGVIAITSDMTGMYEDYGIKLRVFKSTPLKAAGNPYEKLSEEAAAEIQGNIDKTHGFFVDEIARNRNLSTTFVSENIANGKMWYAEEARSLGLIDGVKTFDEVFLALLKETSDNVSNFQSYQDNDMKRKTISKTAAAAIASGVPVEAALEAEDTATELEVNEELTPEAEVEAEGITATVEESVGDSTTQLLKEQIAETVAVKVELQQAQNKLIALEASQEALKKVTAVAIQRAYVAIGSPAPSLEGLMSLDASALLQQHAQVDAQLSARFGAGKQVTLSVSDEADEDDAVALAAKLTNDILLKQARIK